MSFRLLPIEITVAGGSGSASMELPRGSTLTCVTRGVRPPDAAPTASYSYYVLDQYGGIPDSNNGQGRQNWDGNKLYTWNSTFNIVGASADGVYTIDLWFSEI